MDIQWTLGGIAGLIAAMAFVALVALLAVPLLKLGKVLDALRETVQDLGEESVPILTELKGTVQATNTELEKLSYVTQDVHKVSGQAATVGQNAAQVTQLVHGAVAAPLIKVIAFQHGLGKAFSDRSGSVRTNVSSAMSQRERELRTQHGLAVEAM